MMKKKILTILMCMLLFSTILTVAATAGQKTINKEKMSNIPILTNNNNPPNPPEITGPASGQIDVMYTYYFTVTDPDEDLLEKMEIQWGDGEIEEICAGCTSPRWESGSTKEIKHKWGKSGDYSISARVMDVYAEWSEWSEPYPVSMPKVRVMNSPLILWLCEFFPLIVQLLQI